MRTTHKNAVCGTKNVGHTAVGKTKQKNSKPIDWAGFWGLCLWDGGFVQHKSVADYSSATGLFVQRIFFFFF
jgi:hypothetical protein